MNATQIQTLIDTYRQAVIAKDVEKIMALYAEDIVSYDAVKALQFRGKAAYARIGWNAWKCARARTPLTSTR
jgi:ketosteroid isomerase-like protein